jgi:regulatory protein
VKAFDAGVRLLARRPYAGAELSRRLSSMGYEEDEVRSALGVFLELGYIDDATYAEGHVRRRAAKRGPRALAAELAARGVDREIVRQAVDGYDRESQLRAAVKLVHRSVGGQMPASYQELLDSAGAKLLRRGFSHAIAWAACREFWAGSAEARGA